MITLYLYLMFVRELDMKCQCGIKKHSKFNVIEKKSACAFDLNVYEMDFNCMIDVILHDQAPKTIDSVSNDI